MPCPPQVLALVERFALHQEDYRSADYKEAHIRQEFVDPLFEALGWDMANRHGHAEAYKDVIHEDALKIGGATKAPDYCFRIGGTRKFFLEAKKPAVNVKQDASPAFQLRRYAWSAKLPLSILTDFEELAVYDCRIKPDKDDKASTARVLYLRYDELPERWDELASIFSREAILKGSFDKYAESNKRKRGTAEVDAAFLADIEGWRSDLARNLALRNPELSQRDLNFSVQRIIDRIIFLRIAEDRGIEDYGRLQAVTNGEGVYPRLTELFRHADDRYNSGLFHFEREKGRSEAPDELTLGLAIDDRLLRAIIRGLYYPESPYEFSVLSADILGQVYEQFLGKVITLTRGHRAEVEDKPEVKKAGGVYYTPTYIVDYIVAQTVGKLLEGGDKAATSGRGLTPKQASKLKILDPACGSGSFLIGAYQYLLDWHLQWYTENGHKKELYQDRTGASRLTVAERKRILLNNIYGVDIDPQAVEVTKLSLLLKVLEGASRESLERQRRLFHERALPDLGSNIKCGNSLIGPDFYDGQQLSLFSEEEQYRINAFDWHGKHGFPEIMKSGGFDAVIGNPPWGGNIDKELPYFHQHYPESTQDHTDSFKLFIDKGLRLCTNAGSCAMIVPNTVLRQRRLKDIRAILLKYSLRRLVDLGEDVFTRVVAPSCIFVALKSPPDTIHSVGVSSVSALPPEEKCNICSDSLTIATIPQSSFVENPELELRPAIIHAQVPILPLGELPGVRLKDAGINYQRVGVGMQVKGNSDLSERLLYEGSKQSAADAMYWKGSDIDRYWIAMETERYCRPNYSDFIKRNEVVRLATDVYKSVPKILIRQTADQVIAALDERGVWFGPVRNLVSASRDE